LLSVGRGLPGLPVKQMLAVAKSVANAAAGAIVAARESWRGLIVPVAVERQIPGELAPKLDVVGDVEIGVDAAGFGEGGEDYSGQIEVGFVEAEELYFPDN
jgi:hypothetical protein